MCLHSYITLIIRIDPKKNDHQKLWPFCEIQIQGTRHQFESIRFFCSHSANSSILVWWTFRSFVRSFIHSLKLKLTLTHPYEGSLYLKKNCTCLYMDNIRVCMEIIFSSSPKYQVFINVYHVDFFKDFFFLDQWND